MNPITSVYLDLIRFIAALLVVLSHAAYPRLDGVNFAMFGGFGRDAVMIFFVLSGYVIAYADHISPGPGEAPVIAAATIPKEIATHWCIDEDRIFATGHSNGGTIAEVAIAVDDTEPMFAAAAPSAQRIVRCIYTHSQMSVFLHLRCTMYKYIVALLPVCRCTIK